MDGVRSRVVRRDLEGERYRLGRVAHVFIESVRTFCRRVEIKRTSRTKIECARRCLLWRPGIKTPPLVGPSLKHMSFRGGAIGITLPEIAKERQLDFVSIEL